MDFSLTADQQEISDLAARIFGDLSTHERLKEVEAEADRFDRKLWGELASAGLLGLAIPESCGGAGLGFLETCIVAQEAGRSAAAVPFYETTVLGAAPVARFGLEDLQKRWLAPVATGDAVMSAALVEPGSDPWSVPVTAAEREGAGWKLSGLKVNVPAGMIADAFVVPARAPDGPALFLVESSAPGVERRRQVTTSGHDEAELELDGVSVGPEAVMAQREGADAIVWLLERAVAAACVTQAGICDAALKMTARYTSEREQFGKPIATFQAVGQRAADAYIDTEAVRLTAWQAAWRLSEGLPSAAEVAIAKFWADDGAQRVVHACQHLHGGVGVDRDYPLHRYYLLTKQLALTLGGTSPSLKRLGDLLATEPA